MASFELQDLDGGEAEAADGEDVPEAKRLTAASSSQSRQRATWCALPCGKLGGEANRLQLDFVRQCCASVSKLCCAAPFWFEPGPPGILIDVALLPLDVESGTIERLVQRMVSRDWQTLLETKDQASPLKAPVSALQRDPQAEEAYANLGYARSDAKWICQVLPPQTSLPVFMQWFEAAQYLAQPRLADLLAARFVTLLVRTAQCVEDLTDTLGLASERERVDESCRLQDGVLRELLPFLFRDRPLCSARVRVCRYSRRVRPERHPLRAETASRLINTTALYADENAVCYYRYVLFMCFTACGGCWRVVLFVLKRVAAALQLHSQFAALREAVPLGLVPLLLGGQYQKHSRLLQQHVLRGADGHFGIGHGWHWKARKVS